MVAKKIPAFTLISVAGFLNGNYGSSYGQLMSTKQERQDKKKRRKAKEKAQKINRK